MIIVTGTLAIVIKKLPDVYESYALILVEQARVNSNVVTQGTQIDISSRIGTIRDLVYSRSVLKEIIDSYNLYADLTAQKVPDEEIYAELRKHIAVEIRNNGSGANAFTIAYKGERPDVAQKVTDTISKKFIDENIDRTIRENKSLLDQLEEQLKARKKQLEDIETQKAKLQTEHPEAFAENDKTMVGQINALQMQRQSMQSSIDNTRNQIMILEQMQKNVSSADYTQPDSIKTFSELQVDSALRSKKADLDGKLKTLLKVYTEKNPEVQEVKAQLEALDKQMQEAREAAKSERAAAIEERKKALEQSRAPEVENLKVTILARNRELAQRQTELDSLQGEINKLNQKLLQIPSLQASVQKIERDYNTFKKDYDDTLQRKNALEAGNKVASELSGNSFRLQDAANLPQKPSAPKRPLLYLLALVCGIVSGLVVALSLEIRSWFTVLDARDVAHYMKLPLLVTVPQITTENERRRRAMMRLVQVAGVFLLIVVTIPVFVAVLQKTRVLNIFTGVY